MTGRLPDVIGIGAQRAATSWTWRMMRDHPGTYFPEPKEMRFFTRRDADIAEYTARFAPAPPDARCGEFTPAYLFTKGAAPRIAATVPDARLVVVLRNPVDRAYSQWKAMRKWGRISLDVPFIDQFQADFPRFTMRARGMYAGHLKRYLDRFRRDQMFIGLFEDMISDPGAFVASLYEFLGLDPSYRSPEIDVGDPPIPGDEANVGLRISEEDRLRVYRFYENMIPRLEEMIGRDLAHWRIGD